MFAARLNTSATSSVALVQSARVSLECRPTPLPLSFPFFHAGGSYLAMLLLSAVDMFAAFSTREPSVVSPTGNATSRRGVPPPFGDETSGRRRSRSLSPAANSSSGSAGHCTVPSSGIDRRLCGSVLCRGSFVCSIADIPAYFALQMTSSSLMPL